MKRFQEVITQLALWTPPEEIGEITFSVNLRTKEIRVEMRSCCVLHSALLRDSTPLEKVHGALDYMAKAVIKDRDETHAERDGQSHSSSLNAAHEDFIDTLARHAKRDQ